MNVWSPDLPEGRNWEGLKSVLDTTESGLRLLHHLKTGPPFRYARVGWEAGLIPMDDLNEWKAPVLPGECRMEIECVMNDLLYRELGSPKFCFAFREGYWWTRYQGERYLPLCENDQPALKALSRSLFPENSNW